MGRTARILTWSAGIFVGLVVVAVGAAYLFVTSDDFRSRVESGASAYSGRKTHIAKISIDWGSTAHVHLDGVEVANADWGKADHMLKVEQVDFDIRLWPLLKGDYRPAEPRAAQARGRRRGGRQGAVELEPRRSPVTTGVAKAVAPKERYQTPLIGRLEITDGRLSYQDTKRKLSLDGTISTAEGKAGAQPQAELQLKGKLENQPLTVHFIGGSALMLRDTEQPYPIDLNVDYRRHETHLEGHRAGSLPVDRRQRRSHALRTEPVGDLSLAGHSRSADAALPHQRQARARARPVEVRQHQVARRRQRPHRRHPDRRDQEARVPHRQAGVAAPGLRRSGASGRRAAGQDRQRLSRSRSRPSSSSKPPAICFPTCRSIPSACGR